MEQRRERTLAQLLLTLGLIVVVALATVVLLHTATGAREAVYVVLLSGLLALLALAFMLNRRGRHEAAAWLTVGCAALGTWGSILLDRSVLAGDFVPLAYLVLSIFLSSILLPVRVTVVFAAVQFAALLCVPHYFPATATINWPSLLSLIAFAALLSLVANVIHRRDIAQIEEQARQLSQSESRLRELSVRDALTGLFNRRYLEETLERELLRATRKGCPLGLIIVDVDHFKRLNDTEGHAAGDALLINLGQVLQAHVRGSDVLCRYGGEEFVLIMPGASPAVARERAEVLRVQAMHLQVYFNGRTLPPVTVSAGVAAHPAHGATGAILLRAADAALYRAKRAGRNRVELADDDVSPRAHD